LELHRAFTDQEQYTVTKSKPLLSIGLPVYNGEQFLEETLQSILNQSFEDFELIICDNASTDETEAICRRYIEKDARIRYYRNEYNIGWALNHNKVVGLANGAYFKWIAYDDLIAPVFLEKCIEVLDQHPEVVLCYPRTQFIDVHGQPISTYADDLDLHEVAPSERFRTFFKRQGLCHLLFGVTRTDVLKRTSLMGSYIMSDRVLVGELALNGMLCELPDYLLFRRLHDGISTTINTNGDEMLEWIDPSVNRSLRLPRWRRLVEYCHAIERTPIPLNERLRCYTVLAGFVFVPDRVVGLLGDITHLIFPPKTKSWMN
jgi:glycosyltransferase involved in cell wall biosynthesis